MEPQRSRSLLWRRVNRVFAWLACFVGGSFVAQGEGGLPRDRFDRLVAPVLAGRCLGCHSGEAPKGELDLSRRAEAVSQVVPGNPGESLLWQLVERDEMPPKHPLPQEEKQRLRDWIAEGASWGEDPIQPFRYSSEARAGYDWWSLQPLSLTKVPETGDSWSSNAVDRFVFAKLAAAGLRPSPMADPRTLVRRLHIDLLGLPPRVEAIESFAVDPSSRAWSRLVDRLLASPLYGERWARHWMDVARFGESDGFEYNKPREHAWHYRDWLIRSLNADMPYDEWARQQVAGDLLHPGTGEGAASVGFLVAGVHNEVLGVNPAMKMAGRQDELEEIAATLGQAFLGMTVHCARCHDHKFDPISSREYYQFIAALDGVHHGTRTVDMTHDLNPTQVFTVVSRNPPPMRVHHRGEVGRLGDSVAAGGLAAIRGLSPQFDLPLDAADGPRRTQLAQWLSSPQNPLFHRVAVNRVWHYHFGHGLVRSPNDFGFNGGRPSHPALLDWLAVWFREQGHSLKALHRLVLTSATWRQASLIANPTARQGDAENRLLWRQHPRRMDAETYRDGLLDFAGELNLQMFGPGFKDVRLEPVPPANYYQAIDPVGPAFHRRTLYRWQVRGQRSALLDTLDCPDPSVTTPVRHTTTTPSQALSQWNHPFVLRMADRMSERVAREVGSVVEAQAVHAWRLVLGRPPAPEELEAAARLVKQHGLAALARTLFNSSETLWID